MKIRFIILILSAVFLTQGCTTKQPVDLRPLVVFQTEDEWIKIASSSQGFALTVEKAPRQHPFCGQTPSEISPISSILIGFPDKEITGPAPSGDQVTTALNSYVLLPADSESIQGRTSWIDVRYSNGKSLSVSFQNGIPVLAQLKKSKTHFIVFKMARVGA